MQLLDVQPYETALQRLLRAGVCSDDQLHDYHLSQAFRSLAYAVNRASLSVAALLPSHGPPISNEAPLSPPSPGLTSSSTTNASATGGAVVLFRMCTCALASQASLRTLIYVSTRLLCDEASAFGEGNERPCCTTAWVEALCSPGVRRSFLHKQMGVHRRLTLGYLLLLSGTVRAVTHGCAKGKRLHSHFVQFAQQLLADVVPCVALIADTREATTLADAAFVDGDDASLRDGTKKELHVPSLMTVEANNTLLHLFHGIALDVLEVHQHDEKQTTTSRRAVLDRDAPSRIWSVVSILQRALLRALEWVQSEIIWEMSSINSVDPSTKTQAVNETFALVRIALEDGFAQLIKKQETLECSRQAVEKQFGQNSKDYHAISGMMWTNTLRLFFFCRSLSNAWTYIYGGLGEMGVQHTDEQILALIASFVSSVPPFEGEEKEHDVFLAATMLLSGALAAVAAAPAPSMQAALWFSELNLTQQIHNTIVQRGLRYRDENVQKLSALLSRLILYSSSNNSAFRIIADSPDQLLELLSNGRDGASQCVIGVMIRAAVERPHSILPSLFRLLQHGDTNTRRNVLDVLSALPKASDDSAYGGAIAPERMRPVLRLLSEELLLRIQDEELQIRLQSSKLFAKVWPEDVCRSLLKLATQRDRSVKRKSSAQQALRLVVEAHTSDGSVVLLLIQESLTLLGENVPSICATPSTPADILAFATLHCGTLQDTVESQQVTNSSTGEEGNINERIIRLVALLGRHWAEGVLNWTKTCILPLLQRAMEARAPLEQELLVRVMSQIAYVCGATNEGLVALSLSCLHIMKPTEEGTNNSTVWLENLTGPSTALSSDASIYQIIAPLLFLRGCPRRIFATFVTVTQMPPPVAEMWEFLWSVLLNPNYREELSLDAQRLILELMCKYNASVMMEQLRHLGSRYMKEGFFSRVDGSIAFFICRVGFFCIGFLLSQNQALFCSKEMKSNLGLNEHEAEEREMVGVVATAEKEREEEMEFTVLVSGAQMVGRWTEDVVIPWLLSEDDAGICDVPFPVDFQRLSRSAVECLAIVMIAALNRQAFSDTVTPFVMLPLTQLAQQCRERVNFWKENCSATDALVEWSPSPHLLGRFEFAIHIHQRALNLLRAHPSGRTTIGLYFKHYMPPLIELANAICTAVLRFCKKDIAQVAVESCHALFLAVMASTGASPSLSGGETPKGRAEPSKSVLMFLDVTDRNALITFAVGSARYSDIPQVQSEGVKLLSALLGAAPEIFVTEANMDEAPLGEALTVLGSVALMHPDAKTRVIAEQVLGVLQAN
ncbi:hypothetical protein TcYC6_0089250 [Trypanosoma cruzi]|nr:hypothetical protein TcYC6_0089250 [Trypanosoma cruzi]